jgi:hypothetical protein
MASARTRPTGSRLQRCVLETGLDRLGSAIDQPADLIWASAVLVETGALVRYETLQRPC